MNSYFNNFSSPLNSITIYSDKPKLKYVEQVYSDDSYEIKLSRDLYCEEINDWLQKPHVEKGSETNSFVCEKMFNDLLEMIDKNDYKIDDLNQFKEDLIHYMYILSN